MKHSYEAIMRKKQELYKLRGDMKAEIRKLKGLEQEILTLTYDQIERMKLSPDMTPQKFLAFLRQYRGLNNYIAYTQLRLPIRFSEAYKFSQEITSKWVMKDAEDLIKLMQHAMKLTRKQAVAKIIVDMAQDFKLLYEHYKNITNGFVNFVDKDGNPACVCKLAVFGGNQI